ncbi:hypothetical protein BJ508DRAFT_310850 [Ascobolus immersus RN42]|uniref:Uncharacterized protein n=1 Tax=Ascobolus immersus RN42 TaxID=1160509 RepID=A0A3N4HTX9_ASCIM|nr:hypothetical protein BJ508DRAFT_310850 [Ascobolus immersus RN42]
MVGPPGRYPPPGFTPGTRLPFAPYGMGRGGYRPNFRQSFQQPMGRFSAYPGYGYGRSPTGYGSQPRMDGPQRGYAYNQSSRTLTDPNTQKPITTTTSTAMALKNNTTTPLQQPTTTATPGNSQFQNAFRAAQRGDFNQAWRYGQQAFRQPVHFADFPVSSYPQNDYPVDGYFSDFQYDYPPEPPMAYHGSYEGIDPYQQSYFASEPYDSSPEAYFGAAPDSGFDFSEGPYPAFQGDIASFNPFFEQDCAYYGQYPYSDDYPLDPQTDFLQVNSAYYATPLLSAPRLVPDLRTLQVDSTLLSSWDPLDLYSHLLPSSLVVLALQGSIDNNTLGSHVKRLPPPRPVSSTCAICNQLCPSRRRASRHCAKPKPPRHHKGSNRLAISPAMFVELGPHRSSLKPIPIPSVAPPPAGFGLEYKSFSYARISISLNDPDLQRLFHACLDGGCGMSLIDEGFLTSLDLSTSPRTTRSEAVSVQGIGGARHASHEFVSLLVSCPARASTDNSPPRVATFRRDFHIVPDLPCKVLLGNDIAATEELIVDFGNQTVTFPHCGSLVADISLYRPNTTIATIPRLIQATQRFVVPPQSMAYGYPVQSFFQFLSSGP